jgi:NitT/TauT family transport system ATP-binding protein
MEKLLAVRASWAEKNPDVLLALVRAHRKAAAFIEDEANREEVSAILAAPNRIDVAGILAVPNRVDVAAEVIRRTLDGRMKVTPQGLVRVDKSYLLVGRERAARPDARQTAWLYAQMVRWGQAPLSPELLAAAKAVVRPDLYDAALPDDGAGPSGGPEDGIGAFTGPAFDSDDIAAYLAYWAPKRS